MSEMKTRHRAADVDREGTVNNTHLPRAQALRIVLVEFQVSSDIY